MAFEDELKWRSAEFYADFFHPKLKPHDTVLDCGCGSGTITLGLAKYVPSGSLMGIDIDANELKSAQEYVQKNGINKVQFREADMLNLPFEDARFSACLCHSSVEAVSKPLDALREAWRVLKPGGVFGVACVEYEGVLLSGADESLLRKFYDVREKLWLLEGLANPRIGRQLRGMLSTVGFEQVTLEATYISHGDSKSVLDFGSGRSADCEDPWYREGALKHALLTEAELQAIQTAWKVWAEADDSFAAFTWCKAIGRKPSP